VRHNIEMGGGRGGVGRGWEGSYHQNIQKIKKNNVSQNILSRIVGTPIGDHYKWLFFI